MRWTAMLSVLCCLHAAAFAGEDPVLTKEMVRAYFEVRNGNTTPAKSGLTQEIVAYIDGIVAELAPAEDGERGGDVLGNDPKERVKLFAGILKQQFASLEQMGMPTPSKLRRAIALGELGKPEEFLKAYEAWLREQGKDEQEVQDGLKGAREFIYGKGGKEAGPAPKKRRSSFGQPKRYIANRKLVRTWMRELGIETGGPPGKKIDRLKKQLTTGDRWKRLGALEDLEEMGPRAEPAMPELLDLIDGKSLPEGHMEMPVHDDLVRRPAGVLAAIGAPAVGSLVERLGHESIRSRFGAVFALGLMNAETFERAGVDPKKLAATLIELSKKERDPYVQMAATEALGAFAGKPGLVLPTLFDVLLKEKPPTVRTQGAVAALSRIGEPAILKLALRYGGASDETRLVIVTTVIRMLGDGRKDASPQVVEFLRHVADNDANRGIRDHARTWLAQSHVKYEGKAGEYVGDLRSGDENRILRALMGLSGMGSKAAPAVPELIELLDDDDAMRKVQVLGVLGEIGPAAAPAVPRIVRMIDEKVDNPMWRMMPVEALGKIGPGARAALPRLERLKRELATDAMGAMIVPQVDQAIRTIKGEIRDEDDE